MRRRLLLLSSACVMAELLTPMVVHAQAASPGDPSDAATDSTDTLAGPARAAGSTDGTIIVTGTRLRSGLTAPTPVVAVSTEQLRAGSPQQISDALNQLPVFKGSSSSANGTASSQRDNGGSYLNLRGLGKERTLVLLDGRRMVAATAGGATDISLIPQELIKSVEIVTGGASAAYGSDAVAGVVNFRLDTTFEGLRLNAQNGLSRYNDSALHRVALTGGHAFAGGDGHIVASVEYFKQNGFRRNPTGRPILDQPFGIHPSGLANPTSAIVFPSLYSFSPNGLINSGPLAGNSFRPDGTLVPFNFGTNRDTLKQAGGDGVAFEPALTATLERYNVFAHGDYDLGVVKLFAEGLYSKSHINYPYLGNFAANVVSNATTIFRGNPFLPPSAASAFGTGDSFTYSVYTGPLGHQEIDTRSRTFRLTGGLDWEMGSGWGLSAYYMHGENRHTLTNSHLANIRNLYAAIDAVRDPASGNIVCRSTLLGLDPGCVPINLFGNNPLSAAADNFIFGQARTDIHLKQDVASLSVRGSPLTLPAGPVEVALGVEYRRESIVQTSDPISGAVVSTTGIRGLPTNFTRGLPGGFLFSAALPFRGTYKVVEGFGEASVPIFKNSAVGYSLTVNGAVRVIHYSTAGTVVTWKAGAVYEPFADLRLRGTVSRDIRAANLNELFAAPQVVQASATFQGAVRTGLSIRQGNANLRPEKADTLTVGAVYRPSWLPGLGISVDYYRIKLRDAITQLSPIQTANQCALGAQFACNLISFVPATGAFTVQLPTLNLNQLRTSGVDFEVDYSSRVGLGRLDSKLLVNYLKELKTQLPNSAPIDRAGDLSNAGAPKWQGIFSIAYSTDGGFKANLQERYIGSGKIDTTFAPTVLGDANDVGAVWYTDVGISQEINTGSGKLRVYGTVNNLFNRQPPVVPSTLSGPFRSTNFQLYDIIGRFYTVGATLTF